MLAATDTQRPCTTVGESESPSCAHIARLGTTSFPRISGVEDQQLAVPKREIKVDSFGIASELEKDGVLRSRPCLTLVCRKRTELSIL